MFGPSGQQRRLVQSYQYYQYIMYIYLELV